MCISLFLSLSLRLLVHNTDTASTIYMCLQTYSTQCATHHLYISRDSRTRYGTTEHVSLLLLLFADIIMLTLHAQWEWMEREKKMAEAMADVWMMTFENDHMNSEDDWLQILCNIPHLIRFESLKRIIPSFAPESRRKKWTKEYVFVQISLYSLSILFLFVFLFIRLVII